MKKIILALFLFLFISLIHIPTTTKAATTCFLPRNGVDQTCWTDPSYIQCFVGADHYCCDNQPDCDALQAAPPTCASQYAGAQCYPKSWVCLPVGLNPNVGCDPATEQCGVNCVVAYPTPGGDGVNIFCKNASSQDDQVGIIRTAIGCVNASDPKAFVVQLVALAVKIAGGITLISLVYAGFVFTTAFGDKKRIAGAKELFSNSLIFLVIIVLAVTIINFLGVKVLNLNLFGFQV
jgi:hypothetical protein